jgi:UDP-N-acetyl-D-mannosaminuronate dehydrogenase
MSPRLLSSLSPPIRFLFGQNIAVLGFAFKADTGDTRESAAITLIRDFLSERARVTIFDPKVEESQIWLDLSEALPDMPLEQSTRSLFLAIQIDLTHLSLFFFFPSQKAGHDRKDCALGRKTQ